MTPADYLILALVAAFGAGCLGVGLLLGAAWERNALRLEWANLARRGRP